MKESIIYSKIQKKCFKNLKIINQLDKDEKLFKFIYIFDNEKDLTENIQSKEKIVILFNLLNIPNLEKFINIGIKKYLPYIFIYKNDKEKYFYKYNNILDKNIILPNNSKISLSNSTIKIESSYLDPITIPKSTFLSKNGEKIIYQQLYFESLLILSKRDKMKTFIGYFKDINLRKKVTPDTVEKELGKEYVDAFKYFSNIKNKYLSMYERIQKLQFEFEKLFFSHPEPLVIFNNENFRIINSNKNFKKIFKNIKKITDISKYETTEDKSLTIFHSYDPRIESGIVKIYSENYYVFKFRTLKIDQQKYVMYFTDITENTIFEIVSLIKLTFEEAETEKNDFESFAEYITNILKELFNIPAFIELYEKEKVIFGEKCLTQERLYVLEDGNISVGFQFGNEYHEYDKKDIAKSLLRTCKSKLLSDKLKSFNKEINEDLKIAKLIQTSIVRGDSNFDEPQYSLYYQASSNIGGDFAAVDKYNESFVFSIGDVSGHGIASSLISIFINTIIKETIQLKIFGNLKDVIQYIKARLIGAQFPEYMFAALIYAKLDLKNNNLSYVSGAFQFPMLLKRCNSIVELPTGGGILSSAFDFEQSYNSTKIKDDDLLIAFTDGIIELQNNTDEVLSFVKETLLKSKTTNPNISTEILLSALKNKYNIDHFEDDITIFAFRKRKSLYDITKYGKTIYANLNDDKKESLTKYLTELLFTAKENYPIIEKMESAFIDIIDAIIKRRYKQDHAKKCKLKIRVEEENNITKISVTNCKDKIANFNIVNEINLSKYNFIKDIIVENNLIKIRMDITK